MLYEWLFGRARLIAGAIGAFSLVLLIGCTGSGAKETVVPEPTTPADFISQTYVRQGHSFSLSMPGSWVDNTTPAAQRSAQLDAFATVIAGSRLADQVYQTAYLFEAGPPPAYSPAVSISIDPVPSGLDAKELNKHIESLIREVADEYMVLRELVVTVGAQEAGLVHTTVPLSAFAQGASGEVEQISLHVPDGSQAWSVGCSAEAPMSARSLEICEAVVRSFRLN